MVKGGLWRVFPDYDSEEMLMKLGAAIGIEHDDDEGPGELHVTLAYDDSNPDVKAEQNDAGEFFAIVNGAELFGEGQDKILVLVLDSPDLIAEHDRIHACGAAKFSFKPYRPHVTLLKQAKDSQVEHLNQIIQHPGRPPITLRFIEEDRKVLEKRN
ncbi:RNA ligase [Erwinia phage pEa_SNUABM_2]|uniref:Anti-CBASS protein Acb1 n=1 Tax=Erwinia phage pEa_SNUABM_2 TaxID=2869547 RepID=A0AAE8C1N3_9CAUD|nr:RNA ligase [Erwinia phage pEa_SNUABM_2]QZE59484.1 hypothetical protein pEaSNUABM2_00240 [Erwinia phage pEa_SNUABM_2]QZE59820.1 hypothetical protein pEaSNUABM39_00240 [Erwinia phage pEa_SNUABM_39]